MTPTATAFSAGKPPDEAATGSTSGAGSGTGFGDAVPVVGTSIGAIRCLVVSAQPSNKRTFQVPFAGNRTSAT